MRSVEIDVIGGGMYKTSIVDDPTDDMVLSAIRKLDGERHTQVWIHSGNGDYLLVTGPVDGRFAIDMCRANGTVECASVEGVAGADLVDVVAGEEVVGLPSNTLVPFDSVVEVVRLYLHQGELSSLVEWVPPT